MSIDRTARIIIIEDDEGVARLQQKRLERAGYAVATFTHPEHAVSVIQRGETDLMILDYRLPDNRTGLDFYEQLKLSGFDVPAILVTGFSNEALIVKALRAGMKDFVSKSVEYLDYLPEAVAHVLHQTRVERRLAETEARFETIFLASPVPISVCTLEEGRFLAVNDAFLRLFEHTRGDTLGATSLELLGMKLPASRDAYVDLLLKRRSLRNVEIIAYTRSGREVVTETSLELVNFNGRDCVLSMYYDVTERRQAEAALRESENRFQAFMKYSPAFAFVKDATGKYVYVNAAYERNFAPRPQGWIGATVDEVLPPEVAVNCKAFNARVLREQKAIATEESIPNVDGTWRTWLTQQFPIDDGRGNMLIGGISIDITERKHAEQLLELQQRAMNATSEGIIVSDALQPDLPIVYVNLAFEKLTQYSSSEVIGRNCRFLQGPETDLAIVAEIRAAVREGRSTSVEILNYRRDGSTFWNLLSITPVRDAQGTITHFVGVQRDITERRLIAEQMRQSQKMEAIGRLAGGIAHDFNNLLTIVLGNAELAIEDLPQGDPRRELVQEIAHAGQRAASLTTQLLAFSRKQVLEPKVVDLNVLVADTERLLRRLIGEDIELRTVLEPNLHSVRVDPVQIEQILLNLTVNARDAMPGGGRLTIETQNVRLDEAFGLSHPDVRPGRYALLAVSDSGHGMDEGTKARIFEPFFTTKERGKGTGMGLPTVYGIVQQSGGYIWVYSEVGQGTTFKIYLPEFTSAPTRPVSEPLLKASLRGDETLLLVEDEAMVRALARRILESQGYRVLEAKDGAEALEIAAEHGDSIDLLITDVIMPGMGGKQLAEILRSHRAEMQVLYVSGYTDDTIVEQGMLSPGVAFLQKPFTHESLSAKVRAVLNQRAVR